MKLAIDWLSVGVLLAAFIFGRIPGVNLRLGNGAMGAACGFVAYRYWLRGTAIQFNVVMMGLAIALALYYLSKAVMGVGSRRPPPSDDD